MLVLFDNNIPRGLAAALGGHTVVEARQRGWDTLKNGDLLDVAEKAGFDVFLTSDKNVKHQQNLRGRKIAIVVLGQARWSIVRAFQAQIAVAINAAQSGIYVEIKMPSP